MNRLNDFRRTIRAWLLIVAGLGVLAPVQARCEAEQSFDVLTIGGRTYTNVTVTTKSKKYVMLMHSQGLANIKVSELSAETRHTLGYGDLADEQPKSKRAVVTKWANQQIASLNVGQVRAMELNLKEKWSAHAAPGEVPFVGKLTPQIIYTASAIVLILWVIFCACLRTICQKAGKEPGIMLWLPFFQFFPMLKAAGMSPAWILATPFGLMQIVWCFQIAKARGKSALTGLCLLLPVTGLFAFLYLTFSDGDSASDKPRSENGRVGILKLGAPLGA